MLKEGFASLRSLMCVPLKIYELCTLKNNQTLIFQAYRRALNNSWKTIKLELGS